MTPRWRLASVGAVLLSCALSVATPVGAQETDGGTGAGDRSMAFRPGLGDAARERVPGGRLLVIAYGAVLSILGAYVVFIARKATRLESEVRRLEDDLERRGRGP